MAGKSTRGSSLLPLGDATLAALLAALLLDRYAAAVSAELGEIEFVPDAMETGTRFEPGGGQELFLRLEWLPGHDGLAVPAVRAEGLTLEWSHIVGWLVHSGADVVVPDAALLADPPVVGHLAMHASVCGIRCGCDKPDGTACWTGAAQLGAALDSYDERMGVTPR
ncbi:hypothetical protein [Streptomyces sp. NBC_00582]|uniref:hypothetical protein n=1 Tax=Streptomyces sp. NBC_00582 TaxID=2975783 RepID=UPI002E809CEF|nr:hypothetical protein [Streptomyces sp. NBC_00582]WUB61502.1 hypothetical protein OG852_14435 [Streptomyces sp. NBC_00582]